MAEKLDTLDFARRRLAALRKRDLERVLRPVGAPSDTWVNVDGHRLLNLSSNNYLGLAGRPEVKAASAAAALDLGTGAGASRLVSGTRDLDIELETRLSRFKGFDGALVFTSGYAANVGVIPALVGPGDLVIGDELNHASLIDGCRLSRADFKTYLHRDVDDLERLLVGAREAGLRGRVLVVTDTVFSMDGDVAPLSAIAVLCRRFDAILMVDEAHSTGCLGPGGRGLVADLGLESDVTVTMGTLSKAFGSLGAFVGGRDPLREYLLNTARSFIFTTALPAAVLAASLTALDIIEREPELPVRLQANASRLRQLLQERGFNTLDSETQIIPVLIGSAATTMKMASLLRERGVLTAAARPPTVPAGTSRLRVSVMATHTESDLLFAADAFATIGTELGLVQ